MHRGAFILLTLLLPLAAGALAAAGKLDLDRVVAVPADQPIPVEDFLRLASFQRPEPNDSGTHLAALVPLDADRVGLMVVDLRNLEAKPLLVAMPRELNVDSFEWLDDDRLLYHASAGATGNRGTFVARVSRGLGNHAVIEGYRAAFVGVPDARTNRPLLQSPRGDVMEVNVDVDLTATSDEALGYNDRLAATKRNERRTFALYPDLGTRFEMDFLCDKAGELAFARTMDDGVARVHAFDGRTWKECPIDLDDVEILSFGERPGELIVLGPREPDRPSALRTMDAATGTPGEVIYADPAFDAMGRLIRDPRSHQLLGLAMDRTGPVTLWFSDEYRRLQRFLEGNFPGKIVRPWPVDASGNAVFFQVHSDRQPPAYYLADLAKKTLVLIKNSAPWIDPGRMRPMASMTFKTADGIALDAHVTLPAGASKERPAPLVVLPHPETWGRNTLGFHPGAQYFASRGFAVLQPNTRGSVGTAWRFPYEDRWAFRAMHDDVTAATRTLLKTGLIDPNRIAIVGWHFGGYLAVAGAAFEPSLYRCVVAVSGTYDWEDYLAEQRASRFDNPEYGQLVRWLGLPKDQPERYAALSPRRRIGEVRAAVLVAYDKEGSPVAASEARRLIDALKKHGVLHQVVTATGERQGWGRFAERVELYTRIEAFLRQHLAGADDGRDESMR